MSVVLVRSSSFSFSFSFADVLLAADGFNVPLDGLHSQRAHRHQQLLENARLVVVQGVRRRQLEMPRDVLAQGSQRVLRHSTRGHHTRGSSSSSGGGGGGGGRSGSSGSGSGGGSSGSSSSSSGGGGGSSSSRSSSNGGSSISSSTRA